MDTLDTRALIVNYIAIDTFISGNIAPIPIDNQAFLVLASSLYGLL
jgi:hypothetical protein